MFFQSMSDIRYDRIVFCKAKDTKVAIKNNTLVSMDTLAKRIKIARKDAGLTQDELAERCGMTRGGIGHLETGRRNGATNIAQIAFALGVSALWLAEGKGPKSAASLKTVMGAIAETSAQEVGVGGQGHSQSAIPSEATNEEQEIIQEILTRKIPDGIRDAVLTLIKSSPKKNQD